MGRWQRELLPVCHESIYQYIYCVAPDLIASLPRHHSKRKLKRPYRKTDERITNRKGLERRPKAPTAQRVCGPWKADMIVAGDRTQGLNVLVERNRRLTHISVLKNKTVTSTKQAIFRRMRDYPTTLTQSLTCDNGSENTLHEEINLVLSTQSFFCPPIAVGRKGAWSRSTGYSAVLTQRHQFP